MPIKITDLELSQEITPLAVDGYNGVCALVRYHGRPIGWINSDSPLSSVLSIESVTRAVDDQVGWQCIQAVLGAVPGNAEPQSNGLPAVSVIVCIDDSISRISKVLHHLHHLEYPEYEVLLIDYGTAPRDRSEWQTYSTVRYIRCEHASLACARNRGIVEARHSLVAFIAPHSYPDRQWLTVIGSTLAMPHVKAVTGLVAPAELETDAQIQFEHGGYGLGRGLDRRVIRRQQLGDRDLLRANGFGSGANMAFHRETLIMIGQFDPRFTVDLPSGGGEVELLHRLVARGYTLVYEPAALTWYMPRRDLETVRAQVFDQGRAFGLYLLMCFRKRTVGRLSLLRFVLRDWGWKWIALRLRRPGKATRFLVLAELAGALVSPMTLWNGRKRFGHLAADIAGQAAAETGPAPVRQLASPHAAPPPRPQTDEVGTRATIRIVRTWYPHWGQYSGINQFLKFVDAGRYRVTTQLVQENDSEFPLQSRVVREWLRYWVRRKDMAWYNLSDLRGELTTLAACFSRRELVVYIPMVNMPPSSFHGSPLSHGESGRIWWCPTISLPRCWIPSFAKTRWRDSIASSRLLRNRWISSHRSRALKKSASSCTGSIRISFSRWRNCFMTDRFAVSRWGTTIETIKRSAKWPLSSGITITSSSTWSHPGQQGLKICLTWSFIRGSMTWVC